MNAPPDKMDKQAWLRGMAMLRTLESTRLAAALLAFDPAVTFETVEARRMLMATALGVSQSELQTALRDLESVGLAVANEWLQ